MGRPRKDGRYDYKEKVGKYNYFVKVLRICGIDGKHKRKPIRARTLDELDVKVANALESNGNGKDIVNINMGDWSDHWLNDLLPSTVKQSTLDFYKQMMRYLPDDIRKKEISSLDMEDFQKLFQQLRKCGGRDGRSLSSTTVRSIRSSIKSCLNTAIRAKILTTNPVNDAKPPVQDDKREITYLTRNQMQQLMDIADSGMYYDKAALSSKNPAIPMFLRQWSALIRLELACGARLGEIFALSWGDVDFANSTIYIHKNLQAGKLTTVKTKNSRRTITIDTDTMTKLKEWHTYQNQYAEELGDLFTNTLNLVFTNAYGTPVNLDNFRLRVFNRMVKKAGLPDTVTFHSLRHSNATSLLGAVDAKTISMRLGHSSVAFTLKTYTHLPPERDEKAASAIGEILSSPKPKPA